MDIRELKQKIESNTLDDNLLVLKYDDCKFICNQYINRICKNKNLQKILVNDIKELSTSDEDLFDYSSNYLYVYDVDKLDFPLTVELKNLIIVCKHISDNLIEQKQIVIVPKLLNWQIEDYLTLKLPGLTNEQIKWLCQITNYKIERLEKESLKLEIFPKDSQQKVFNILNYDNAYCDLNSLNIFNFTNAIVNKDYATMCEILENIKYIDIEPTGVVTLLLQQFKKLIDVTFHNVWNASLSCSEKQFYYYKHNLSSLYNEKQLVDIYQFLTEIDYKLKSGYIDNQYIIDYVIGNLLSTK